MSHEREIRMHLVSRAMKALRSLPTIDEMAAVLELVELVCYPTDVKKAEPQPDKATHLKSTGPGRHSS